MPELPDVVVYIESLQRLLSGHRLRSVRIRSPFLVRSLEPDVESFANSTLTDFERIGKRIVWRFDDDRRLVFHLMIAGRFHWRKPNSAPSRKTDLAAFGFEHGVMMLTEASAKKRASLHALAAGGDLAPFQRGGLEVLNCGEEEFAARLLSQNRTLKRALTDPRLFSGIGNAYSDEALHAARLSPIQLTQKLNPAQIERLHGAVQLTLSRWIDQLRQEAGAGFPERVTAFRDGMAVHGRFGEPCPVCRTPVQRIVYAENETNYCPSCQTGGKLLADRSLSRLLKSDWPKTIDEWMDG